MKATTILLVEDGSAEAKLAIRALEKIDPGCRVVHACTGSEAMQTLFPDDRDAPGLIADAVILDVDLPDVDGLTVLDRIRDDPRTEDLVTVVFSGSTETSRATALEHGADGYELKVDEPEEFHRALERLSRAWRTS